MAMINWDEESGRPRPRQPRVTGAISGTATDPTTTTTPTPSVPQGSQASSSLAGQTGSSGGVDGNVGAPLGGKPLGTYSYALQGFDTGKLNNAQHTTPKYIFARLASKYAPTPAGFAQMIADPEFKTAGFTQAGADKIRLPDGTVVDVGLSFSQGGGKGWAWQPTTGAGGTALPGSNDPYSGGGYSGGGGAGGTSYGGGYSGGVGGIGGVDAGLYSNLYNDEYTNQLEQFVNARLRELYQPVNDPFRTQLGGALQERFDTMGGVNDPTVMVQSLANTRANELIGPGYSGAEKEIIRTDALDPIERDRTAAKQRMLEQLSARGLDPDSGIAQEALLRVDAAFDASRAEAQREIALNELSRRDERQNSAVDMAAVAADAWNSMGREKLDLGSALEQLSRGVRSEESGRRNEALALVTLLAELGPQRMQQALAVLGQGESPASLLNSIAQINNVNNQNTALNNQNTQGYWSGLGSLAAIIAAMNPKK